MKSDKGFTRSDLVIIVLCATLLFTSLGAITRTGREQAKMLVCQTNLKRLGYADALYLDDNDGWFVYTFTLLFKDEGSWCRWHEAAAWPPTSPSPMLPTQFPNNAGPLWPYLQNKDVLMCPTFYNVAKQMGCANCAATEMIFGSAPPLDPQYSYSKNAYLNGDGYLPVRKITEVKQPSKVINFTEENSWFIEGLPGATLNDNNFHNRGDGRQTFPFGHPSGGGGDVFATFHKHKRGDLNSGYANAVFVDGHVERVSAYDKNSQNSFYLSWPHNK